MKLLTKADLKRLPPLYSQSEKDPKDVLVPVKFFNPGGAGSWFATEFDPVERSFFGYVTGLQVDELGYFSLDELQSFRGRFGLGIERDRSWDYKTTLEEVMSGRVRW